MRRLLAISLLAVSAACNSDGGTAPDATVIRIRLRDDRAAPGGRNQVLVTLASGERIDAHTNGDGDADIRVTGAGIYQVRVIPRAAYISTPDLSRSVTLVENESAVLNFTLHRVGSNGEIPEPTIP